MYNASFLARKAIHIQFIALYLQARSVVCWAVVFRNSPESVFIVEFNASHLIYFFYFLPDRQAWLLKQVEEISTLVLSGPKSMPQKTSLQSIVTGLSLQVQWKSLNQPQNLTTQRVPQFNAEG